MVSGSARNWIAVNAAQQSNPQQKTENKKMTTLLLRNSILRVTFIAGLLPVLIGIEAAASAAESPAPR